jgi:DNA-binding response OmpR family regulator
MYAILSLNEEAHMPETKRTTLLVVEDDTDVRELLQKSLSSEYEVVGISYGEGASELAESYQPDLILLDVALPGISGFEVCKRLRAHGPTKNLPILFLTALSGDKFFAEGLVAGGDGWMAKPFDIPQLKKRIEYMLRGPAVVTQRL